MNWPIMGHNFFINRWKPPLVSASHVHCIRLPTLHIDWVQDLLKPNVYFIFFVFHQVVSWFSFQFIIKMKQFWSLLYLLFISKIKNRKGNSVMKTIQLMLTPKHQSSFQNKQINAFWYRQGTLKSCGAHRIGTCENYKSLACEVLAGGSKNSNISKQAMRHIKDVLY